MGGYGSSRWGTTVTRLTTEGLPMLDVRALVREAGGLVPGTSATVTWDNGAAINTYVPTEEPDAVILEYSVPISSGRWLFIHERMGLATSPCQYGGARTWFLCLGCNSRRAVLFSVGGRFRCRQCHDLAYTSTRER